MEEKEQSLLKKAFCELENLQKTHSKELKNIANIVEELRNFHLDNINSKTCREIEKYLIDVTMKSGYAECLMFFRILLLKKTFLWSEEKCVAFVDTDIFESEYHNLFSNRVEEEDFPNDLKYNKLLNYFKRKVKSLNSKDLFLEFDFSFEDVEPYKDKKFSLFYNTKNSSFSIYPISGSTIQIVDGFIVEEIVAKESGNKKIILNKFLLSNEEMIPYFIEEWAAKTINVLFNIIKFGNEKRIEFLDKMSKSEKSFSEKHSIITDMKSLEVNEFITKGLISDDGIFPFYLLEENKKLNKILMEQIKIIPENELSMITNYSKEFIYKKFKN